MAGRFAFDDPRCPMPMSGHRRFAEDPALENDMALSLHSILPALHRDTLASAIDDLESFASSSTAEPEMQHAVIDAMAALEALKAELADRVNGDGPDADGPESQGMQWLVLGMVPGPVTFLVGTDTRRRALEEMKEQDVTAFEYAAVVKARDFFNLG